MLLPCKFQQTTVPPLSELRENVQLRWGKVRNHWFSAEIEGTKIATNTFNKYIYQQCNAQFKFHVEKRYLNVGKSSTIGGTDLLSV